MTKYVVLTGAGISAESGIRTFRASDGLWENQRIEDVASPAGFLRNPDLVYDFYNQRRRQLLSDSIKPNKAHLALAKMQQKIGSDNLVLVTQNVDDLHERAGAQTLHMHGELLKARCENCRHVAKWLQDLTADSSCEKCKQSGKLRPHIVWFGEMPLYMPQIEKALATANCFVSIGTSGAVYPAAGFVALAQAVGATTVEINLEPSDNAALFEQGFYGKAASEVPRFIDSLFPKLLPSDWLATD